MPINVLKSGIAAFGAAVFFIGCSASSSQNNIINISPPSYMLEGGQEHFQMRLPQIEAQPKLNGGILLAGDSITEGWLGYDIDLGEEVSNHGIGWDTVTGLKSRLPQMLRHNPDKLFILIGTNDIGYKRPAKDMALELTEIVETLLREKPGTKVYIQSVMPRELESLQAVEAINKAYADVAREQGVTYINLMPVFAAPDGTLKPDLTYDGLHLNQNGYEVWAKALKTYIQD